MSSSTEDNPGTARPSDAAGEYSALAYIFRQLQAGVRTATLVQVKAVTNTGGVTAVGKVDVTPMVHQVDGNGAIVPHGVVHDLPYFRLQGGTNAVILDPQVGDIGLAVFADRDTSSVVATKAPAAPGSARRNNFADGFYIGGLLNGTPVQFVQFTADGITVKSPTLVTIDAPKTKTTQDLEVGGNLKVDGSTAVQAITAHGVSIDEQHTHGGVQSGGSQTAVVTP